MDLICSGKQDKIPYLPQTGREENKSGTCRDIRPAGYRGDDYLYRQGNETHRRVPVSYQEYIATLQLGATTPSFDLEKEIDATYPTEHITRELVEEALQRFIGRIEQIPPVFSACKVDGKRAYDLARKGEDVELKAKTLIIDEIELLECNLPEIKIRVVCSKGTYIRALARDIGEALNSGAHLTGLIRTRVGDVRLEDCLSVESFPEWLDQQEIEEVINE